MRFTPPPFLGLVGMAALCLPASAANSLDDVQKLATEWARLRSETARIQSDWTTERQLLEASIQALELRAAGLEENRQAMAAATAAERNDQTATAQKIADATTALKNAETRLLALSDTLARLRPSLPPRLSAALELPYRGLAKPGLPATERMQLVMTILSRSMQFNKVVTYAEESVRLEGAGEERLLRVLYWGLGQAYALDASRKQAYLGRAKGELWHWEPVPDATDAITRLFDIQNDKADPAFVEVPLRAAMAPLTPGLQEK